MNEGYTEREANEQVPLNELHPNFNLVSGKWVFNHFWDSAKQGPIQIKVRSGFNEISSLDDISCSSKFGLNTDEEIPTKYVLFMYGRNEDLEVLREIGQRLPFAELITNTAFNGKETERSQVERIR